MLSSKQHLTLAHYVSMNQHAQREAGKNIANPEWKAKRAQGFLALARMTARHGRGGKKPHLPKPVKPLHGATRSALQPQPAPSSALVPNSTQPQMMQPNAPAEIIGTPGQFGAGLLQAQGAIPGASVPGAVPPAAGPTRPLTGMNISLGR